MPNHSTFPDIASKLTILVLVPCVPGRGKFFALLAWSHLIATRDSTASYYNAKVEGKEVKDVAW